MKNTLIAFLSLILVAACAGSPPGPVKTEYVILSPLPQQKSPSVASTTSLEELIEAPDLSAFISIWNSGDLELIRSLYKAEARYFNDTDITDFYKQKPVDVLVRSKAFSQKVKDQGENSLKIIGKPFGIYDKLTAFQYERESSSGIQNGVTLLRFEDGKVLLQVDIPEQDDQSAIDAAEKFDLPELMRVWNEVDYDAAKSIYSPAATILSDEDLLQATWRDFKDPPKLNHLLKQFKGWNPEGIGKPLQVGNIILFPWHWYEKDFPVGFGLRVIQVDEGGISKDIRFVIRPWETSKPFLTP